jgi:hypothetical protein
MEMGEGIDRYNMTACTLHLVLLCFLIYLTTLYQLNGRVVVIEELERTCNEVVVVYFNLGLLFQHLPKGLKKVTKSPQSGCQPLG